MDRIVKQIENGPGELDIIIDVLRQISHHPYFTLNGVKLPVSLNAISRADSDDSDSIDISGVVLVNEHNHHRYHGFKARYNVRTRRGSAVFETTCRECGSEVSEFGLCPKCDPCRHCGRRDKPPYCEKCSKSKCSRPGCSHDATHSVFFKEGNKLLCDTHYKKCGITGTKLT